VAKFSTSEVIRQPKGDDMTDAKAHIEAMQRRLEKMAAREEQLVEALNEALSRADRKLLDDVRAITLEHEARRTIILTELQSLAARVGAFPASARPIETIEYEVTDERTAEKAGEAAPKAGRNGSDTEAPKGGDWRTATRRIAEELSLAVNGAPVYGGDTEAA
jgi:hypothetical protein